MAVNTKPEGVGAAEGVLEIRSKKSGPSNFQVLIGVVCLTSAASIYAMRHLGVKNSGALQTAQIGVKPQGKATTPEEFEAALLALERSVRPVKPVAMLFERDPFNAQLIAIDNGDDRRAAELDAARRLAEAEARRAAADRIRRIETAVGRLEVQSVMGGRRPMANINGEIHTVGSKIGEFLTVESIEGRRVVVVADELRFELEMGGDGPRRLENRQPQSGA